MAVISLPDGRTLAYQVLGDRSGQPVIALHGTPGSWRQLASLDGTAREHHVAMITPDRAGYGGSGHDPARTIASGARDLGELMTALALERCAVVGLSGGGPTALAAGVILADRVSAVATIGGVGPMVPREPSLPPDRLLTRMAGRSETVTRMLLAPVIRAGRARPDRALRRFAALLAEPDARLIAQDAAIRDALLDDLRHASPASARAMARDFSLFARPWDIDLASMAVPAHIWHGSLDRNVPVAHAHLIVARCPAARLHIVEGGGHLLMAQIDDIIASLTTT